MPRRVQNRTRRAARPAMMIVTTQPAITGYRPTQSALENPVQRIDDLSDNVTTLNGEVLLTGGEIDAWRSTPRWE